MDHYETLGIGRDADPDAIRRAYLEAARRSHPDFHAGNEADRSAAEARMRRLNTAWEVLSDPTRRAGYDATLTRDVTGPVGEAPATWRPHDPSPPEPFDERHDRPITSGGIPGWLRLAPVLVFATGVAAVVVGGVVNVRALLGLGVVAIVVSAVLFVVAPMVALFTSHRGSGTSRP